MGTFLNSLSPKQTTRDWQVPLLTGKILPFKLETEAQWKDTSRNPPLPNPGAGKRAQKSAAGLPRVGNSHKQF